MKFAAITLALPLLALAGCADPLPPAAEPEQARQLLRQSLDAWKGGETPDALAARTPPVLVRDRDWQDGARLDDYRLDGDGQPLGLALQCPVTLTLKDAKGKARTKKVVYVVNTAPAAAVSRQDGDF